MSQDYGSVCAFTTAPQSEWELLSQGAEAKVWKLMATGIDGNSDPQQIICKERFSKSYRHPDLDERLTKSRCRGEARVLEKCTSKSAIRVPRVIRVEPPLLYMEYIDGPSLKSYLVENGYNIKISFPDLAKSLGDMIGKLHNLGIVHGDLTTSNMLVLIGKGNDFQLMLIDFGLAKSAVSAEEQAVDLYVLERALESTHPDLPEDFLDMILNAYSEATKSTNSGKPVKANQQSTLNRLEQVRQRGRKRECFG